MNSNDVVGTFTKGFVHQGGTCIDLCVVDLANR